MSASSIRRVRRGGSGEYLGFQAIRTTREAKAADAAWRKQNTSRGARRHAWRVQSYEIRLNIGLSGRLTMF